ncbi:hypothetical protein DPMN_070512 [Dreissena polymorpha]|uniref:Uncharacterized protein n=1 Tax=Dreissena polymorpha TaxID=45954 RepID=A0A9D3Z1G0_DREPO|nr:hypothetical protein DPMN_070512 [Dreissena polymorpha]
MSFTLRSSSGVASQAKETDDPLDMLKLLVSRKKGVREMKMFTCNYTSNVQGCSQAFYTLKWKR